MADKKTAAVDTDDALWPFGRLLRERRADLHLSRDAAAKLAGISPSYWQSMESGKTWGPGGSHPINPSAAKITMAAQALGLNVQEALRMASRGDESVTAPPGATAYLSTPVLVSMINELAPPNRTAVQAIVEALAKAEQDAEALADLRTKKKR